MPIANLHLHTFFSDGQDAPHQVMRRLLKEEIGLFALTDHDTLSGIEPMTRALKEENERAAGLPVFVAGIEMSAYEPALGCMVHILGYFPGLLEKAGGLAAVNACLAEHMDRIDGLHEGRIVHQIKRAFELDADHVTRFRSSPAEALEIVYRKAALRNARIFRQTGKQGDICRLRVPLSFFDIAAAWPEITPEGTEEKALLYALRPNSERQSALQAIFIREGMGAAQAEREAARLQGATQWPATPVGLDIPLVVPTLELLKAAGAITSLAHPAHTFPRIDFAAFDRLVLLPLKEAGLDGIEVYYLYSGEAEKKAFHHYSQMAKRLGLRISGGSDYHGGGRCDMRGKECPLNTGKNFLAG